MGLKLSKSPPPPLPLTFYDKFSPKIDIFGLEKAYGWPNWAVLSLYALTCIVMVLFLLESTLRNSFNYKNNNNNGKNKKESQLTGNELIKFRSFQIQYLTSYLLIMLADWLQGTNMYTLYSSYGVDVGLLFQTGFLSSAIFGTFLGLYVDKWGRKLGCIIFCVLEIVINTLEHYNNIYLLLIGRVLGGMSTSLLFSAFESWMVSEHRYQAFPEHLLGQTFAFAASGNGIGAILAGLLAQRSADILGDIGPFQLAIAITILVLILVCFWRENYGTSHDIQNQSDSVFSQFYKASQLVFKSPAMLCVGLSQAFFEGAVYSFVFMWVPSMIAVTDTLPTGLVFSCFMLAMTAGGLLTSILLTLFPNSTENVCNLAYLLSALCVCVPIIQFEFTPIFASFLMLEAMVGVFNSAGAMLRSEYYPEGEQASIISFFRLPLNLLVFFGTSMANAAGADPAKLKHVFAILFGLFMISVALLSSVKLFKSKDKTKIE